MPNTLVDLGDSSPFASAGSSSIDSTRRQAQLHQLQTERAYDDYEAEFGINIKEASVRNLARVRSSLGELTAGEKLLAEFFVTNLTAKHKTFDFDKIKEEGALISVGERVRSERKVKDRHVSRRAGDDNIFFTVGIGNHDTPSFLNEQSGGHTIELRLKGLFADYEGVVNGLFVSGHLSDYQAETITRPTYMGDTFFQLAHDWKSKTKTYTYQYPDGKKIVRTISIADEIFCGKDVLEGLALQFIEQLRFIGGSYYKHILDTIVDPRLSVERKIEIMSVAMRHIMPGWIYPEAKLPGKFVLDPKNTHFTVHDDSPPKDMGMEIDWDERSKVRDIIKHALASSNLALLKRLIDEGKFSVKDSLFELIDHPSYSNRKVTADFLVSQGADISARNYSGLEALSLAAKEADIEMVDILLSIRTPDPKDPTIIHGANLNHSNGFSGDRNLLEELCFLGHYEVLDKLLKAGMAIRKSAVALAYAATIRGSKYKSTRFFKTSDAIDESYYQELQSQLTFLTLLNHGADITEELGNGKTALMEYIDRGNIDAIRAALSHGARVNERYHFIHLSFLLGKAFTDSEENGFTALHFLMLSKAENYQGEVGQKLRLKMAQALLEHGADINLRADSGDTAYSLAVKNGHLAIADMLKARGADTRTEKTPFEECYTRKLTVVAVVKGIKDGKEVIVMGKKMGDDGLLKKQYLMPGGFQDADDESSIAAALREWQEETGVSLKPLVESGEVKPEILYNYEAVGGSGKTHYRTTYVLMNVGKHLESMKLRARDDFYAVAAVPLESIVSRPDLGVVKQYSTTMGETACSIRPSNGLIIDALKAGVLSAESKLKLDTLTTAELDGEYQLLKAAESDNLEKVRYLLALGVPADPSDDLNDVPMAEAAYRGRIDIVKALVEAGAALNRIGFIRSSKDDLYFYGPLSAAVKSGNKELFDYLFPLTLQLLTGSMEFDEDDNNRRSKPVNLFIDAMSYAAKEGNIYAATKILGTGFVGANDKNGQYTLVHAAKGGHKAMVELLLSKGADVNIACDYDMERLGYIQPSPILVAMEAGHPDIALLLLHQADVDVNKHRVCGSQELWKTIANPLFAAIHFDQAELAIWILEHTNIQLSTRQQLKTGWRPEVGLTTFEFAQEKGQTKVVAAIAKKMMIQQIAKQLDVKESTIETDVQRDDDGKGTIHIILSRREQLEPLATALSAPVKQDPYTGKFYIRLGEVRSERLLNNGKALYAAITAELKPVVERREELVAAGAGATFGRA